MFYVILDIVDLKRNYLFAKKCMDSEIRVEQTMLLIMSHSHAFSHKIKIMSVITLGKNSSYDNKIVKIARMSNLDSF